MDARSLAHSRTNHLQLANNLRSAVDRSFRNSERNNATGGHSGLHTPLQRNTHVFAAESQSQPSLFCLQEELNEWSESRALAKCASARIPPGWKSESCCFCWYNTRPCGENSSAEAAFPPRLMVSGMQAFYVWALLRGKSNNSESSNLPSRVLMCFTNKVALPCIHAKQAFPHNLMSLTRLLATLCIDNAATTGYLCSELTSKVENISANEHVGNCTSSKILQLNS